ncbi:MAG: hypothetical protein M1840_008590, partial [Geoglossum simile]
ILDKYNKMQEAILNNRTENRSGKRMVIKGHFALSTKEILEKVRKAERETVSQRKAKGKATQRGKKRKRPDTPSENEEESTCNSDSDSSHASDCIVVGKF